jgi:hypothetical protein
MIGVGFMFVEEVAFHKIEHPLRGFRGEGYDTIYDNAENRNMRSFENETPGDGGTPVEELIRGEDAKVPK